MITLPDINVGCTFENRRLGYSLSVTFRCILIDIEVVLCLISYYKSNQSPLRDIYCCLIELFLDSEAMVVVGRDLHLFVIMSWTYNFAILDSSVLLDHDLVGNFV